MNWTCLLGKYFDSFCGMAFKIVDLSSSEIDRFEISVQMSQKKWNH
jgi:hypothetical protein